MKVICINGVKKGELNTEGKSPLPASLQVYEGEVYTVLSQRTLDGYEFPNGQYYILAERGWDTGYGIYSFLPLSDIDESEMVRNNINDKKEVL